MDGRPTPTPPRRSLALAALLAACLALPAAAHAATYRVETGGADAGNCTATPCETVGYAIDQHRISPDPSDVIEVGPGTFVGNVEADDPADDGLTIRGTLSGGTRQTTLRGEGAGVPGLFGPTAVLLGACGTAEVDLLDVNVDTEQADSDVYAIEAEGGSDLTNVHASNQPGSDAGLVLAVCQAGTAIRDSTIELTGSAGPGPGGGDAGILALEGFQLVDSHVLLDSDSYVGILQASFFGAKPRMVVRRSWVENDPLNPSPGIVTQGAMILDSSLITGGEIGVVRDDSFGNRARWRVRNATIDVGNPGEYDSGLPDLLLTAEDGDGPIEVSVANSILAEEIISEFCCAPGPGSVDCSHTDVQDVVLDPPITDNCVVGANGNTTTNPAQQFADPVAGDWSLLNTAPALEAGTPGPVPPGFSDRDLAGNARLAAAAPADCSAPVVDMGAYEFVGPPCNVQKPVINNSANPTVGTALSANPGKWTNEPTSFRNTWSRCDANGSNCQVVRPYQPGSHSYTPTPADLGHTQRVRYIATNAAGDSKPAPSAPTGLVSP